MGFDFPVCVIGAGPAGATAARLLAQGGCRSVTLLEKSAWPRGKTCAGGIGPRGRQWLAHQGLLAEAEARGSKIAGLRFTAPSGRSASLASPREMALVIPRDRFDALLVDKAIEAGVDFRPSTGALSILPFGNGVAVKTPGGDIEAAAVVVAAGAIHRLAGNQSVRDGCAYSIMARFENFAHAAGQMEMIYSRSLLPYYAWLFPEPGDRVNIGLMADPRRSQQSLHALFDEVIDRYFSARHAAARPVGRRMGAPLRSPGRIDRVVDGRVMLAGESAGLVNCATGEGIPYALESAELAAGAIIRAAAGTHLNPEALGDYQRALERRFAWPLRASALFRSFIGSAAFPLAADVGTHPLMGRLSAFVLAHV